MRHRARLVPGCGTAWGVFRLLLENTHLYTHAHMHTREHTRAHMHTRTHTHAHAQTRARVCTAL
jgi:hypothetical protein